MSWNTLTDRQKQLDRLIDGCGIKLDSSDSCLRKVMRAIGADVSETFFVKQRIELRLRTAALLNETDKFIPTLSRCLTNLKRMTRSGAEKVECSDLIFNRF